MAFATSTLSQTTTLPLQPGFVERTTTLAVITVVGFIGNLMILVTICQSASLRAVHFNKHLVNIATINLLTCILGIPIVIGYTVTSDWDYGEVMCRVLAHFILSISIALCFSIFVLNIDRVIAIADPERYAHRMNSYKTVLMIVIVWIAAILFPLPLSLGVVPTTAFGSRYICSIGPGSDINYLIALYSVCFALPSIVNVLCFIYIAREALSEKEAESTGVSRRSSSTVRLWPEVQSAGVVFILFLLWVLSELPYITLSSIEQYIHSSQVNGSFNYSPDLDTVFMWLKFCSCCLLPFAVFRFRKDIWLKFKDLMFCRKSNSILDSSPRTKGKNKGTKSRLKQSQPVANVDTPKFEASFPIPTLKASKDGLHVQGNAEDEENEGAELFYANMDLTAKSKEFDSIRSTKATIEYVGELDDAPEGHTEETSDYETDRYSQSDPISVGSAASRQASKLQSVPALDGRDFRTTSSSISHDSGSGSAPNSVKKRRKKGRAVADLCVESDGAAYNVDIALPSTLPQTLAQADHVDVYEPSYAENKSDRPKHKSKSKKYRSTDDMASATKVIETVDDDVPPQKVQKKKKRKKRTTVSDAETNTSQVMNLELVPRKIPPPRLEPIKADVLQNAISTPPLRSKFVDDEVHGDSLTRPPSGVSAERRRKHRASNDISHDEVATDRPRKKKSSRPRKPSGDSQKGLMSSNASSEISGVGATVSQHFDESQL